MTPPPAASAREQRTDHETVRREILARLRPLASEEIALEEAGGRTLARAVSSRDPLPPFDNSAMDGFALRHADVAAARAEQPVRLRVQGIACAGELAADALAPGAAFRIYTGAPIPRGADTVVPFEQAQRYDDGEVVIASAPRAGACVRRAGGELRAGDLALDAGVRLTAGAIGLLAMAGCARVEVFHRPRVAVHSSGSELLPVGAPLSPGKIRNSNLASIAARLREVGAEPLPRAVLPDTLADVRAGLRETMALRPDAIITTGGISAGDLDLVREVARELGSDMRVRAVDMKPGKPLVDGLLGGIPYFGLPGNPASCLVSFEVFVRPALALLEGRRAEEAIVLRRARLRTGQRLVRGARLQFVRATAEYDGAAGEYLLDAGGGQDSHMLGSFARANCLAIVPAGEGSVTPADAIEVLLL